MRTLVEIEDEQIRKLDEIANRGKQSRSAVIRKAVADYIAKSSIDDIDEAFGLWGDKVVDGLEYQEKLRSEW